jgi:N-acetylmuramic acid 6-phosphate etherase
MISTISMIQLGKVFDNLMVDMQISNQKLQLRACRIVQELTGLSQPEAAELLSQAQGEVKTALLMQLGSLDYAQAKTQLQASGGQLRKALESAHGQH